MSTNSRSNEASRELVWLLLGSAIALQFVEQRSYLATTGLSMACAACAAVLSTPVRRASVSSMLILYLLWCGLSTTWSDSMVPTLEAFGRHVWMLVLAVTISARVKSWTDYRSLAWWWGASYIAMVCVAALVSPSRVRHEAGLLAGDFRGLAGHKSAFGTFALLAVVGLCCGSSDQNRFRGRQLVGVMGILAGSWMVLESGSATAYVGAISCALLAIVIWFVRQRNGPIIATVAVLLPMIVLLGIGATWTSTVESLGKDSSLTGRTVVWSAVSEQIGRRPFIGFGFEASWRDSIGATRWIWAKVKADGMGQWQPGIAHNSVLEVLLGVGVVGLLLLLAVLVPTVVGSMRLALSRSVSYGAGLLPLLQITALLMYSVSERGIGQDQGFLVLALIACCLAVLGCREPFPSKSVAVATESLADPRQRA